MWVIDFEASGLSPKSYPIEVAITDGSFEYEALIKPLPHWQFWDKDAEKIHNIKQSDLAHGEDSEAVACYLNQLLDGKILFSNGPRWDRFWADILFSDNGITRKFAIRPIDEVLLGRQDYESRYMNKKKQLEASGGYKLHRALDDARIIWCSLNFAVNPTKN